jgi:hypothetical protein
MKEGKERKSFWGCHALADLRIFWKHTFNLIIYVQRDVKLFNLKFFHLIGFKNVFLGKGERSGKGQLLFNMLDEDLCVERDFGFNFLSLMFFFL